MKKTAVFMLTFIVTMGIFLLPRPLAAKEGQVTPQEPEMTVQKEKTPKIQKPGMTKYRWSFRRIRNI